MAKELAERKEAFQQIAHPKRRRFLENYVKTGRIGKAAAMTRVSRFIHYHWMKDENYAKAFQQADEILTDVLVDEVIRRGCLGYERPVTYKGKVTDTFIDFSDSLLMFEVKKRRPEYRENAGMFQFQGPTEIKVTVVGTDGKKVIDVTANGVGKG